MKAERKPRPRRVVVDGRETSVSLDDAEYAGLRALAAARGLSFAALVREVDAGRAAEGLSVALQRVLAAAVDADSRLRSTLSST